MKYGATLMEVDVDGTLSYPEPQINSKDNGKHKKVEFFVAFSYWIGWVCQRVLFCERGLIIFVLMGSFFSC